METVKIEIETENAAFDGYPAAEIARILRAMADDFEERGEPGANAMRDINGNTVAKVTINPS